MKLPLSWSFGWREQALFGAFCFYAYFCFLNAGFSMSQSWIYETKTNKQTNKTNKKNNKKLPRELITVSSLGADAH